MDWVQSFNALGHRMFIEFVELKIEGNWKTYNVTIKNSEVIDRVLEANHEENCIVKVIEPDGIRRTLHFNRGATINLNQNILSYYPEQTQELTVDEKAQAGKGKTRDIL